MRRVGRIAIVVALLIAAAGVALYAWWPDCLVEAEYARLRLRAGATEHRITIGDHEWVYLESGVGPPMVLIHGFSGSKENWLPTMAQLDGWRLIALDLPGWGESTRLPDADYSISAQALRVRDFLSAMNLERPRVVGHSMGGHIAGVLAARHRDALSALDLVAPAGLHFTENEFARRVLAGETPFNVSDRAGWDALMRVLFVRPPWLPPRVVDALVARNVANHGFHDRVIGILRRGEAAFQLERELAQIQAPTRATWCRGDQVLDVSSLDALRAGLPNVRIEVLADCGHMPMMEKPRELAAVLATSPTE